MPAGARVSRCRRRRRSSCELVGRDDPRLGRIYTPNDRVAAQAWNSFEQARIVSVPPGRRVGRAGGLNVSGMGSEAAVFNHLVIDIGANARATLVLQTSGLDYRPGRQCRDHRW